MLFGKYTTKTLIQIYTNIAQSLFKNYLKIIIKIKKILDNENEFGYS